MWFKIWRRVRYQRMDYISSKWFGKQLCFRIHTLGKNTFMHSKDSDCLMLYTLFFKIISTQTSVNQYIIFNVYGTNVVKILKHCKNTILFRSIIFNCRQNILSAVMCVSKMDNWPIVRSIHKWIPMPVVTQFCECNSNMQLLTGF